MGDFDFQQLEEFIFANDLHVDAESVEAADLLRECATDVQEKVCSAGPIRGSRDNKIRVLKERIRKAGGDAGPPDKSTSSGGQAWGRGRDAPSHNNKTPPHSSKNNVSGNIEDFLVTNAIDEKAAEDFRRCPSEVIAKVLARGDLSGTKNPSSALIARIRDARKSLGDARRGSHGAPSEEDINSFIAENSIDERAAADLLGCSGEVQAAVLDRGDLSGARNPSSALLARIRDARKDIEREGGGGGWAGSGGDSGWGAGAGAPSWRGTGGGRLGPPGDSGYGGGGGGRLGPPNDYGCGDDWGKGFGKGWGDWGHGRPGGGKGNSGAGPSSEALEAFIARSGIDDRAANELRGCSPNVIGIVINRGGMGNVKNPSSCVLSRIKEARKGADQADWSRGTSSEGLEAFISNNGIDDQAADALRCSPAEVIAAVLDRGDLSDARNPSSMLLARMKEARADGKAAGGKGASGKKGKASGKKRDSHEGGEVVPVTEADIESFLGVDGVDDRAAADFRSCPPDVQAIVIAKGSLSRARNPSALLLSRTRDARKETGCAPSTHLLDASGRDYGGVNPRKVPARDLSGAGGDGSADITDFQAAFKARLAAKKRSLESNGPSPSGNGDSQAKTAIPTFHFLELPQAAALTKEGFPRQGVAMVHDNPTFVNGQNVLEELVSDVNSVTIKDDPDWEIYPDVGEALIQTAADSLAAEANCFCVALSPDKRQWGVGIGAAWEMRESAAKLALCLKLVGNKLGDVRQKYPEFGELVDASTRLSRASSSKKAKVGW